MFRALDAAGWSDWQQLRATTLFDRAQADGTLVATRQVELTVPGPWVGCLRHERVPFVSYPYEWSFGMLKDAALLQLGLLSDALAEDLILKDATPYNVQWQGAAPVFIDVGSFTRLEPGDAWVGYRQFCKLFLYPLMLQAYKSVPFQPWLRGQIDGLEPTDVAELFSLRDLLRAGVATHVKLQATLQTRSRGRDTVNRKDLHAAGYDKRLIERNVANLIRLVARLEWSQTATEWSHYSALGHYSERDADAKAAFVRQALAAKPRGLVWDMGANTGAYSKIAAEHAQYVVAMDADPLAVDLHYRQLAANGVRNVLPLLVDVTDPSPNLGWRTRERRSLTDRAQPDAMVALALIHHVVIGRNVPMPEFMAWLAECSPEIIIEFVGKRDPMVQLLLENKLDNFHDYSDEAFRSAAAAHFEIVREQTLQDAPRTLFHLARRAA